MGPHSIWQILEVCYDQLRTDSTPRSEPVPGKSGSWRILDFVHGADLWQGDNRPHNNTLTSYSNILTELERRLRGSIAVSKDTIQTLFAPLYQRGRNKHTLLLAMYAAS